MKREAMTPEQTALAAAERLEQELRQRRCRRGDLGFVDCYAQGRELEALCSPCLARKAADTLAVLRAALEQSESLVAKLTAENAALRVALSPDATSALQEAALRVPAPPSQE